MSANTKKAEIEPRLLSMKELTKYTGLGQNKARIWAEEVGAVRRIGARVLFDKQAIDAALDTQRGEGSYES
ncbi:MAG: polyprenyl synthetase solanesyl diphosphate synthase [Clostridia bacterium]|nr:polyprenyl synthetase solanesyl diphosphate synthase [Clostridia bacterium]